MQLILLRVHFSFFLFSAYSRSDRQAVPSLKQTGSQEHIFANVSTFFLISPIKILSDQQGQFFPINIVIYLSLRLNPRMPSDCVFYLRQLTLPLGYAAAGNAKE
jgi:hypothetical protein